MGENETHAYLTSMVSLNEAVMISCPLRTYHVAKISTDGGCTDQMTVVDEEGNKRYIAYPEDVALRRPIRYCSAGPVQYTFSDTDTQICGLVMM